jgi:hypothetical protein
MALNQRWVKYIVVGISTDLRMFPERAEQVHDIALQNIRHATIYLISLGVDQRQHR